MSLELFCKVMVVSYGVFSQGLEVVLQGLCVVVWNFFARVMDVSYGVVLQELRVCHMELICKIQWCGMSYGFFLQGLVECRLELFCKGHGVLFGFVLQGSGVRHLELICKVADFGHFNLRWYYEPRGFC